MERVLLDFFLSSLTSFPVKKLRRIVEFYENAEEVFKRPAGMLFESGITVTDTEKACIAELQDESILKQRFEDLTKRGIRYVGEHDTQYPERFLSFDDRPFGLFYKGSLPDPEGKAVSIVGSRRCSRYGKESAVFFAESLSKADVSVISGMALGIDGYAGSGAVKQKNRSFAVLAGSVDLCYPMENLSLYMDLFENGGVISERPPGYPIHPYDFPLRNRLISMFSDAVIVIEAALKSGSLITAEAAISQNKEVFALPGRITDPLSAGCHGLIKNGAQILTCPEDVLQFLGVFVGRDRIPERTVSLDRIEAAVFSMMDTDEIMIDDLVIRTKLPVSELVGALVRMEMKGAVKRGDNSGYVKASGIRILLRDNE